jgi:uncharacterized protein YuzE
MTEPTDHRHMTEPENQQREPLDLSQAEWTYDSAARMGYLLLRGGIIDVDRTEQVHPQVNLDLAEDGSILGIEVLG